MTKQKIVEEEITEEEIDEENEEEEEEDEYEEVSGCPRQVHLVNGMNQVMLSSHDPTETMDFLSDRAITLLTMMREELKLMDDGCE